MRQAEVTARRYARWWNAWLPAIPFIQCARTICPCAWQPTQQPLAAARRSRYPQPTHLAAGGDALKNACPAAAPERVHAGAAADGADAVLARQHLQQRRQLCTAVAAPATSRLAAGLPRSRLAACACACACATTAATRRTGSRRAFSLPGPPRIAPCWPALACVGLKVGQQVAGQPKLGDDHVVLGQGACASVEGVLQG